MKVFMNHDHGPEFNGYNFNPSAFDYRTPEEFRYGARRNFFELAKLINRLFDYHSRILVVRVDLGYGQGFAKAITLETAQKHRDQLLAARRDCSDVFDGLLGYAWCLEYGDNGSGYHYHFLAFYNGATRRDGVGIGMGIGNLWRSITNLSGKCYVCNFDESKLAKIGCLGIGMIHRDDVPKRICLIEKVAAYLTKKCPILDAYSGRTESGTFRTFGKSWMPEPLDQSLPRRGRPPNRTR